MPSAPALKDIEIVRRMTPTMRPILHANFGDRAAKPSSLSGEGSRANPPPQLPDDQAGAFQAELAKARAAWRASRGRTRTVICKSSIARRGKDFAR